LSNLGIRTRTSGRRLLGAGRRSGGLALALILLVVPTALGKHQEIPPGGPNEIGDCTDTPASPCIEWPKTGSNLSWPVDVYLSDMLPDEEVNLKTDVRNSFNEYNPIAARNPMLSESSTSGSAEVVATLSTMDYFVYAATTWVHANSAPYHISHATITFNRAINWNRSLNFDCYSIPNDRMECKADARKVANHEMGHVEGLSHQAAGASSIMIQGALTYYHIGAADTNNIILIYGAYP
jgi:predicted Zn-dependent protease